MTADKYGHCPECAFSSGHAERCSLTAELDRARLRKLADAVVVDPDRRREVGGEFFIDAVSPAVVLALLDALEEKSAEVKAAWAQETRMHRERDAAERQLAQVRAARASRWVCVVNESGYHNGVRCSEIGGHSGWGCGLRWFYDDLKIQAALDDKEQDDE